jgi:hypothetical protein
MVMARKKPSAKKRGRERQEEPEDDFDEPEDDIDPVDPKTLEASQLLTALLIVAFAFIFIGIILSCHHMYTNYDTPFLLVVKKGPGESVKDLVAKDMGGEVADDEEDDGEEDDGEEDDGEEDAEEGDGDEEDYEEE